ncbi:MAG TPA: EamA family transporter [Steroidobacteraceae bacterium]|nr:EamA family transporter [Steroidobacteraceae bacterium]
MRARPPLLPVAMLLAAMCSIQFGASLAKSLFPVLGPAGATAMRLVLATLILLAIYKPWRGASLQGSWRSLLIYGASLGFMNLAFYLALERVPMGIVVAIEFLGPLGVAIAASGRVIDFAWVLLAVIGLALLLPLTEHATRLDPIGVLYALLAGLGWALYIVFGTKAGTAHGSRSVAIGMLVATAVVLPAGVAQAGTSLLTVSVLPIALAVAVFSSALPYTLEMYALTRIPTRTFGIFMSIEPALAALTGLAVLGERLTPVQWLAIGCVTLASIGSAGTSAIRDSP